MDTCEVINTIEQFMGRMHGSDGYSRLRSGWYECLSYYYGMSVLGLVWDKWVANYEGKRIMVHYIKFFLSVE